MNYDFSEDRSGKTKQEFVNYMIANPELRFWQAIRNFTDVPFVVASEQPPFNFPGDWDELGGLPEDTFHREGK